MRDDNTKNLRAFCVSAVDSKSTRDKAIERDRAKEGERERINKESKETTSPIENK